MSQHHDLFQQADRLPFAHVHFRSDPNTQLQAIIAIHDTTLGPALGGTRLLRYASTDAALQDALRLARGMTYKAAVNQLPFGGGKAVILCPPEIHDRTALMLAYGDFVESLGGQYMTAVDSGTSPADMDIIARRTSHVVCTSDQTTGTGDPSPYTARGVLRGIQAAVKSVFDVDTLAGLHVLIQGVGHVGLHLAELLYTRGARLSVSDVNQAALTQCCEAWSAQAVAPDDVYTTECDVFAPCALGQIINPDTIQQLQCRIIAGSANNQLSSNALGETLRQKGILYAPDYVINAGGMLQIGYRDNPDRLTIEINRLYDTLLGIFQTAQTQAKATHVIADHIAEQTLIEHR